MEHHEDNAQFDNYLQNRLSEGLQISGGAEHHLHLADAVVDELSAPGIASSKSDPDQKNNDGEEDEEWKYIHEVQQSEKLQQQQQLQQLPLASETGNGFGPVGHSEDLVLGNGGAPSLSLVDEEDVGVIKNDGDLSTNSNTTTSTDEVVAQDQQQTQEAELLVEQHQQQQLQTSDLQQEDEDEPSSVATTYGTSSLSENNPTPLDQEDLAAKPVVRELLAGFDNKENCDYVDELEENHSQLNPNAVAFVPNYGSQPTSPLPAAEEPLLGLNPRQLLPGGPLDDLVAESPRKGSARENMDAIAVPDEREFDIEADKRPHQLEQESDLFGEGNLEMQLLNGVGAAEPIAIADVLDHGPETSVDMDLDQLPASDDIMKQSIYADHNASIEDILNSVQPLPTQTGEEKELLHVEEKEHVSQSPSTEELQFQQEFQHDQHQPSLFNNAKQDLMQASFYLEHSSQDPQKDEPQEQEELPAKSSDIFGDQSLLLDTSAPQFSPESDSPVAKLELESQHADIVDITPSPHSSTEEKHLVEDTKELVEDTTELVADAKELVEESRIDQEPHPFEPFSVGAPPQMEEYAAFNAVPGSEAQMDDEISAAKQGINPFAQPFTPAHLSVEKAEDDPSLHQPETLATNFQELQLREELVEEQYVGLSSVPSKFDLCDKVANNTTEEVEDTKEDQHAIGNFDSEDKQFSASEEELLPAVADVVVEKEELASDKKIISEEFASIKEQHADPEEQLLSAAIGEPLSAAGEEFLSEAAKNTAISEIEEDVLPSNEPSVDPVPETKNEDEVTVPLAEVASVATVTAAVVAAATKSNSTTKTGATAKPKLAASAVKTSTTSSSSVAGANKSVAGRPRTAPVATKTTSTASKLSTAAPPTTTTRKPLSSNASASAKPVPKLSSTRPATAPASKVTLGAKPAANKPAASGTALGTVSGSGTRTTARPLTSAPARKPATGGTGSGIGVSSTARRPAANAPGTGSAPNSGATSKPRLAVTSTAPAKPKTLSPRATSGTTTVRKVPSTNVTSLSARSPTKPAVNGQLGKTTSSSSTTTTTTTTITKTFTARPAPKFNHSASSSISNASTTRRLVSSSSSGTTAATLKKTSPSKTSPVKAASKPLTPKPKESVTNKASPAVLKARKSTPLKGATPIRAAGVAPPSTTATTNGNAEEASRQNGNGLHDFEEAQSVPEQPAQNAEASLLDF
ncbi:205 kDa microtubule-associated protein [Drosophila biarmipes]|uniref:205 kDa microtubule-associated protein n=1 Tax=Drosophila biarmipes TaxID=125945 RepID=UPI0007E793FA|nr:205 kDa microtubule-associated protein [Drosophila biarmipes]